MVPLYKTAVEKQSDFFYNGEGADPGKERTFTG
jgi:hypothetical protein